MVRRVPLPTITAAPIDETEGMADDASSIVFGDYRNLLIGMRENGDIRVFDQPFVGNGQIAIVAHLRADIQLSQPKSFTKLTGIIPATYARLRAELFNARTSRQERGNGPLYGCPSPVSLERPLSHQL